MKILGLLFSFFFVSSFFFSCIEHDKTAKNVSLRDSVMKLYKEETSLNRKLDTSEFNYKLLAAYMANDSGSLIRLSQELMSEREDRKWWEQLDSCIKLVSLPDMNIDEGYRIEYDGAFCSMRQITTIYKQHDTVKLNFSLYQLKWDTADCKKLEEYDRVLTLKNWEEFRNKIDNGDFWGLKSENDRHGVDGSTWYITGFKKGSGTVPSKYHFVYRWGQTSLQDAFEFATVLAANKKGCFWMRVKK